MRLSEQEAKTRVAKGAALLDELQPGWASQIDIAELRCAGYFGCILGQVFGDYGSGRIRLFRGRLVDTPEACGFFLHGGVGDLHAHYAPLQDAWIEAIADRLIPQVPSERPRAGTADVLQPLGQMTGGVR